MPQPVMWWWTGGGRSKQVPIGLAKVQVSNNNYINYINKFTQLITNSFISQDFFPVLAFLNSFKNSTHGEDKVEMLLTHYGLELSAETVLRDKFLMPPLIVTCIDLLTEKSFGDTSPRKDIEEGVEGVNH